jgi:hypothetical protein
MLERIASHLTTSVEAVAADLLSLDPGSRTHVIVPVIVTTAALSLGLFKPSDIDLATGEVERASFREVPVVRFRKSLGLGGSPETHVPSALSELAAEAERTVFVVNAAGFVTWLEEFELTGSSWPWQSARARVDAGG